MTNGLPPEMRFHYMHLVKEDARACNTLANLFDKPFDLLPCVRFTVPNARIDPLAAIILKLLTVFLGEDGIGGTNFVTNLHKAYVS